MEVRFVEYKTIDMVIAQYERLLEEKRRKNSSSNTEQVNEICQ